MSEQDYIPGTTVIQNLVRRSNELPYGTDDQRVLDEAETFYVSTRMAELDAAPIAATFTFAHMRQIHGHLFQDVYAWAGEPRRVPMQKLGTDYAPPGEMNALLRHQYASIAEQNYLRGIGDREEFAGRLATLWGEINHAHAFREGNTRSQTVFFEQLAASAGWKLDVARLSPHHPISVYKPFVDARFEHQRLRSTEALSAQEAAQKLGSVLFGLVEPDRSPEGDLRRGVAPAKSVPARDVLHERHPELRDVQLDRYGLAGDEGALSSAAEADHQL